MNNNPQYNQNMSSQNIYQQYNQNIYQQPMIKSPLKYPFIFNKIKIALEFETDIANVYSEEEVDELAANIKSAVESNVPGVTGTEIYTYMTKNDDPDECEIGLFSTM